MNILLTGFEPFGEFVRNSSYDSIKVLNDTNIGLFKIVVKRLPVSYKNAGKQLKRHIEMYKPKIAISFGMGTEHIQFESIALNINYATRKDNDGVIIEDEKEIIHRGSPIYKTTLPYKKIARVLKKEKITFIKSFHAGTYLCNNIFYHLMHFAEKYGIIKAGFIHVPPTKNCVTRNYNKPTIDMKILRKAINLIIQECIK